MELEFPLDSKAVNTAKGSPRKKQHRSQKPPAALNSSNFNYQSNERQTTKAYDSIKSSGYGKPQVLNTRTLHHKNLEDFKQRQESLTQTIYNTISQAFVSPTHAAQIQHLNNRSPKITTVTPQHAELGLSPKLRDKQPLLSHAPQQQQFQQTQASPQN